MSIKFSNVAVHVQGSGIMAESVSIETSNSLISANGLGFNGVCDMPPSGPVKTTISFSYNLAPQNEPVYATSSGLRSYLGNCENVVHCGGLTASPAYLERYSINFQTNSLVKATASYVCFTPLVGSLRNKLINLEYPGLTNSGCAHVWASDTSNDTILGMSYDFSQKWDATYSIGSPSMVNVLNYGGQQTLNIIKDIYVQPTFSGVGVSDIISNPSIQINSLSIFCGETGNAINLDMGGAKVISSNLTAATKDIVRTTTTVIKYH